MKTLSRVVQIVTMDVEPAFVDELNRWYDEEHIPLLSRVPGVLRARRFFDPNGKPRYVALYDLADESVVQHPEWQLQFDSDKTQAVQTRRKLYDQLATDRTLVQGYHFTFPGVGYMEKAGSGYRLVAAPWNSSI